MGWAAVLGGAAGLEGAAGYTLSFWDGEGCVPPHRMGGYNITALCAK